MHFLVHGWMVGQNGCTQCTGTCNFVYLRCSCVSSASSALTDRATIPRRRSATSPATSAIARFAICTRSAQPPAQHHTRAGSGACDSAPNAMRALRARAHTDTAATRSFTAFAVRDKASERSHARAASTAASALSKSPVRARRRDAHERMPRCAAAAGRMTLCTQRRTALLPHRVEPRDALRKRDHSRACSERVCSCCCR